jgi:hypothetical protein
MVRGPLLQVKLSEALVVLSTSITIKRKMMMMVKTINKTEASTRNPLLEKMELLDHKLSINTSLMVMRTISMKMISIQIIISNFMTMRMGWKMMMNLNSNLCNS